MAITEALHVAIIMDGNGRWAERRGLPRVAGHRAGVAAVRRVVERASDLGMGQLTLYAFSCDNWRRPTTEVQSIFWLLRAFLRLDTERLRKQGVRLQVIGRRDRLSVVVLREIDKAEAATKGAKGLHLRVAIDYGARDAITRAAAGLLGEGPLSPRCTRGQVDAGVGDCGGSSHPDRWRDAAFRFYVVGMCVC